MTQVAQPRVVVEKFVAAQRWGTEECTPTDDLHNVCLHARVDGRKVDKILLPPHALPLIAKSNKFRSVARFAVAGLSPLPKEMRLSPDLVLRVLTLCVGVACEIDHGVPAGYVHFIGPDDFTAPCLIATLRYGV